MFFNIVFLLIQSIVIFQFAHQSIDNGVQIVHIDAVKMKYSVKQFTVKSGSLVEIHFSNKDVIRHNLLILAPGSLEKVGKMADLMATTPDGVKKEWVPEIHEVLFYTPLVQPGNQKVFNIQRLGFYYMPLIPVV